MTEAEIVERCRRLDREAQHELYARTSDRIYRLLLRMTGSAEDAADLTQDTYLRVFDRIDQFKGSSSIATWIYRVAVNEAQQHFRRRGRHEQVLREQVPPAESATDPEQARAANRMDVHRALQRLPDEDRILLSLRYFEGMDYAQMAEVLEKPAGTIASGLNRARRALQEALGRDPG